jgi:hypothetical protein
MMKILLILLVTMFLFVGISSQALATSYTNSGTWIGTFAGNDDVIDVYNEIIRSVYYTGPTFLLSGFSFFAKVKEPDTFMSEGAGDLYIGYGDENKSGTWATFMNPPDISGDLINFYSVKGGNEYAIYWEDPATDQGTWSTDKLLNGGGNIPAVSHISGWVVSSTPPEPATMLLLGAGLIGLAGFGRKKILKKIRRKGKKV